ncbi:MAG: TolC family protein [Kiritimatiellia bacterium]
MGIALERNSQTRGSWQAARQRPELQAALARIAVTRSEIAGSRAAYWPTLSAGVSAGRKDTEFVPEQDEWSAGLSLDTVLS